MTIQEMREARAKLVADMRALLDKAGEEKREASTEENDAYTKMEKDFDDLGDKITAAEEREAESIKRIERQSAREKEMEKGATEAVKPEPGSADDGKESREVNPRATDEYRDAYNKFLAGGQAVLSVDEERAMQADNDTGGGFLVTPEQFMNTLIQELDNMVYVRQYATVIPLTNAGSLGAPALDNDPADPTWTAELLTGAVDTTMSFDKRVIKPQPLAQQLKVSKTLARLSTVGIDGIIRQRLAYKFGVVLENGYLNGTGVNQPLGVFTASNDGISTGRDASTGNTNSTIKADGLLEAVYTLKKQYRTGCRWAFHRDAMKMIRKLKTGDGQYIWQPGLQSGEPETILSFPVDESEYVPSTFTTGLYVGILADWKQYWIADAMNMAIQVLTELFAQTNQNGYIARMETDGAPVDENAFVRVTLT